MEQNLAITLRGYTSFTWLYLQSTEIKLWEDIDFTSRFFRCVPLKIRSCATETETFFAFYFFHSNFARILIGSLNIYSALVIF